MTTQVNISEAKSQLSRLVASVLAGEDVVIARAGNPMVRLVPVAPPTMRRRPGTAHGQIWMSGDFDDDFPSDVAAAFWGEHP